MPRDGGNGTAWSSSMPDLASGAGRCFTYDPPAESLPGQVNGFRLVYRGISDGKTMN